jgi:hypothetical protein
VGPDRPRQVGVPPRAAQQDRGARRERRDQSPAQEPRPLDAGAAALQVGAYQQKIGALLDERQRNRMREVLDKVSRRLARARTEQAGGAPMGGGQADGATAGPSSSKGTAGVELDDAGERRLAFLRANVRRDIGSLDAAWGPSFPRRTVRTRHEHAGLADAIASA